MAERGSVGLSTERELCRAAAAALTGSDYDFKNTRRVQREVAERGSVGLSSERELCRAAAAALTGSDYDFKNTRRVQQSVQATGNSVRRDQSKFRFVGGSAYPTNFLGYGHFARTVTKMRCQLHSTQRATVYAVDIRLTLK